MPRAYQKTQLHFPSPSLPNTFFFSFPVFLSSETRQISLTKVYRDIMISAKSDKPNKDGRSQENYKKAK